MYQNRNLIRWAVSAGIILLVVLFAILLFSGALRPKTALHPANLAGKSALTNVHANSGLRMSYRGKINAEEAHSSYRITIRPDGRSMQVYQGYLKNVVQSQTYGNNLEAYSEFSHAMSRLGLMSGNELTKAAGELKGLCPTGQLTVWEVLDGDETVKTVFHTSCGKDTESYAGGQVQTITRMFQEQIIDYRALVKGVKF